MPRLILISAPWCARIERPWRHRPRQWQRVKGQRLARQASNAAGAPSVPDVAAATTSRWDAASRFGRGPRRYQVSISPLPFTETVPLTSHRNSSLSSSYVTCVIWM